MAENDKLHKIIELINSNQKLIEKEFKELGNILKDENNKYSKKDKEIISSFTDQTKKIIEEINSEFNNILNHHQSFNFDKIQSLKESLDGQLNSFKGYAHQLAEDNELKLVGSLDATLSNIVDLTKENTRQLVQVVERVGDITKLTTDKPIEILRSHSKDVNEQLHQELRLQKDNIAFALTNLQGEFKSEINTQVEKVYMGITMTKEGINGVIKDTLSRLEENLNRLTQGIDANFATEVGVTQDLIHRYEGKMFEAITQIQEDYEVQLKSILDIHLKKSNESFDELKVTLDQERQKIISELQGLNAEQEMHLENSLKQLDSQIQASRANVIESNGSLKDDIDKLLSSNSETIGQFLADLKGGSENHVNKVQTNLDNAHSQLKEMSSNITKDLSNNIEESSKVYKSAVDKHLETVNVSLKDYEKKVKLMDKE
ncbi:MAG: hypothetical protein OEZ01_04385 [Candidatus Heimdallarchaeota archaeon]|nr:hypothetical protein [Candidatus Heimdallarchaeota archaeon]MDH5645219.1 hypothetical protein [Candidatus Heimdallarchaeota archaeon]